MFSRFSSSLHEHTCVHPRFYACVNLSGLASVREFLCSQKERTSYCGSNGFFKFIVLTCHNKEVILYRSFTVWTFVTCAGLFSNLPSSRRRQKRSMRKQNQKKNFEA